MWTVLNVYETVDGFASLFTAKDELGLISLIYKYPDAASELYSPTEAYGIRFYTRDDFDFNDSMERMFKS